MVSNLLILALFFICAIDVNTINVSVTDVNEAVWKVDHMKTKIKQKHRFAMFTFHSAPRYVTFPEVFQVFQICK